MVHQQQVRLLTKHHIEQQQADTSTENKVIAAQQVTNQGYRLNRMLRRQSEECRQMKARHQQEELDLEQAIDTHSLEN